jgi:DNA-binding response OmpR family regulator
VAGLAKHILVVDDETPILDAVAYALRKDGFRVSVALNAEACMRIFREDQPALLVLDVMLPSASGFDVCKRIREAGDTPIILLTALGEERYRVHGLELGADDYITKPFSVRELVARVKAVLRRQADQEMAKPTATVGGIVVDELRHQASVDGRPLQLSPKEFALLAFLVRHPDIVFSRQTLLDKVWGADAYVEERTVDVHVSWLRSKIEADPAQPHRLLTIRGLGYKLVGEAQN